jgi:hypothetical protein
MERKTPLNNAREIKKKQAIRIFFIQSTSAIHAKNGRSMSNKLFRVFKMPMATIDINKKGRTLRFIKVKSVLKDYSTI